MTIEYSVFLLYTKSAIIIEEWIRRDKIKIGSSLHTLTMKKKFQILKSNKYYQTFV